MHPLALAESGWVWVGTGSWQAGLQTGRASWGLRRMRPCRSSRRCAKGGRAASSLTPSAVFGSQRCEALAAGIARGIEIGIRFTRVPRLA